MDGGHTVEQLRDTASACGVAPESADYLVQTLAESNVLVDDEIVPGTPDLSPDAASASLLSDTPDNGDSAMTARQRAHVRIQGAGRVGSTIARLVAAAGVGTVSVDDTSHTSVDDVSPGGLDETDVGLPRDRATRAHLGHSPRPADGVPDLVVLGSSAGPYAATGDRLVRDGVPHIVAQVIETTGVVGPLVVPGESPCLRCVELHRTDADPAWPLVIGQSLHRPAPVPACDVTLSASVGALAASHVVAHLDGFTTASVGGTIEITLPAGQPRRRTWQAHPACGCTWDDAVS